MNYFEVLKLAMPETIVSLAALAVLFVDLGIMRSAAGKFRRMVAAAFGGMGCLVAIFWMCQVHQENGREVLNGMLVVDPLTQLVKQALLVLTVFTAVVSLDSSFTDHVGEYFALLLLATVGTSGWMMGLDQFWGVNSVETLHETAANVLIGAVALHVIGAIVESVRYRENLPLAMVTGYKRAPTGTDIDHAPAAD